MLRKAIFSVISAAAFAAVTGSASAATMTFDNLPNVPTGGGFPSSYTEDGITMTGNGDLGDGSYQNLHLDDFGTAAPSRVQFTMAGLFNAISFDLTPTAFDFFRMDNAGGIQSSTYKNVLVQGYQGSTVVSSMLFNMGSAFNTYTVSLGDGFKNLTSLAIEVFLPQGIFTEAANLGLYADCNAPCSHFDIDNVVLAPVPLPATMGLGATGLAMLGLFGYRRRKSV